jgi:hypothetical protein
MSNHLSGDGQPRPPGRTATAIQSLSPGYFPFVMATSIVDSGSRRVPGPDPGRERLSFSGNRHGMTGRMEQHQPPRES